MITAWIGSVTFFSVMIIYILLVLGLPLGEFAMGGKHKVLPVKLRIACAVSILVQIFAILVLMQLGNILSVGLPHGFARGAGYFFSFYLVINSFMNGISNSKKEKLFVTPLSVITAFCFFFTTINS